MAGPGICAQSKLKLKALRLDGVNEYGLVGNLPAYQKERTNAFSFGLWARWTSTATPMSVVNKLSNITPFPGYDIFFAAGQVGLALYNRGDTAVGPNRLRVITTATGFNDGRWHFILGTYDGSSSPAGCHIWVDAVDQPLTVQANNLSASILTTAPFAFGARPGPPLLFPYEGELADVFFYDTEVQAADVPAMYASRCPPRLEAVGPSANLVSFWRPPLNLAFPAIVDLGSAGNNATLTNMEAGDVFSR